MEKHVRILAVLNIVWGSLGALAAVILLLLFGGAMGIVASVESPSEARVALPILGLVGGLLFFIISITSFPSIIAGIGLLRGASWARILTIVVSALHILNIPFGTALGIYGLWVLTRPEGPGSDSSQWAGC